jgi:predicted transposase YbfD/YdcC
VQVTTRRPRIDGDGGRHARDEVSKQARPSGDHQDSLRHLIIPRDHARSVSSPIHPVVAYLTAAADEHRVSCRELLTALSGAPDPRARRGVRHEMPTILEVALCAVLAGARSFAAIGVQAIQITRKTRKLTDKKWRTEVVHAVTSLTAAQATNVQLKASIRGHWCVENRLHWVETSPSTRTAPKSALETDFVTPVTFCAAGASAASGMRSGQQRAPTSASPWTKL